MVTNPQLELENPRRIGAVLPSRTQFLEDNTFQSLEYASSSSWDEFLLLPLLLQKQSTHFMEQMFQRFLTPKVTHETLQPWLTLHFSPSNNLLPI